MKDKAQVITEARMSLEEERHVRVRRYLVMMGLRVVVLVLCAVLAVLQVPLLWLWLLLGVAIVSAMPWMTVLLANDRLVTRKMRKAEKAARRRRLESDGGGGRRSIGSD
ncbi:DUF3099 domain-containing protein [Salininema proteolyticum]|uniref:DUF3099 domain-containing protein n=1 Tax=Salininema proteolyticum TaxID=1607685 RepID=A0ABV8U011_9ACTN